MNQNIARLDYTQPGMNNYLFLLHELASRGLIVPTIDRDLTDAGRQVVSDAFGDTLNIEQIVRIVEVLRQGRPNLSQLDAFVYEASDVVWVTCPDTKKTEIDIGECKKLMPRRGTYYLAGISVLREATKKGLVTVNPPESPNDRCYIKYN